MKKSLAGMAVLLLAATAAQASISVMASDSQYSTTADTGVTNSFNTGAGDTLVVALAYRSTDTWRDSTMTFGGVAPTAYYQRVWGDRTQTAIAVFQNVGLNTVGDLAIDFNSASSAVWGYSAISLLGVTGSTDAGNYYNNSASGSGSVSYSQTAGDYVVSSFLNEDWQGTDGGLSSTNLNTATSFLAVVGDNTTGNCGRDILGGTATTTGTSTIDYTSMTRGIAGQIVTLQTIPEPATIGLVGLMGGGLLFIRRRFMM